MLVDSNEQKTPETDKGQQLVTSNETSNNSDIGHPAQPTTNDQATNETDSEKAARLLELMGLDPAELLTGFSPQAPRIGSPQSAEQEKDAAGKAADKLEELKGKQLRQQGERRLRGLEKKVIILTERISYLEESAMPGSERRQKHEAMQDQIQREVDNLRIAVDAGLINSRDFLDQKCAQKDWSGR